MIRTPLRPLARILAARREGENPDSIEQENLAARHEADRDQQRERAEGRRRRRREEEFPEGRCGPRVAPAIEKWSGGRWSAKTWPNFSQIHFKFRSLTR